MDRRTCMSNYYNIFEGGELSPPWEGEGSTSRSINYDQKYARVQTAPHAHKHLGSNPGPAQNTTRALEHIPVTCDVHVLVE